MRSEKNEVRSLLSPENRERFGIHYLGLSLILAWYYCLWFSPSVFSTLPITDDAVTFSWLSTLALTGFAFLVTPFVFTKLHIYKQPVVMWIASAATCVATIAFGVFGTILNNLVFGFIVFPVIFAAGNAIMWVAWGELHAIRKSNFSLHKFSLSFGITMLAAMGVTTLLPYIASNVFVAFLPLLSAMLYRKGNRKLRDKELPTLLPKATRAKTSRATYFHLYRHLDYLRGVLLQHRNHPCRPAAPRWHVVCGGNHRVGRSMSPSFTRPETFKEGNRHLSPAPLGRRSLLCRPGPLRKRGPCTL